MIGIYEDAPFFVDGVEFSGADGNVLRNNAIFLDALAQQPIQTFTHGIYAEAEWFMGRNKVTLAMPRAWWGAFQFRTGLANAVYEVAGTPDANERIRIYHKKLLDPAPGVLLYDQPWPSITTSIIIPIDGLGYVNNEIIETVIEVYYPGPTYPKAGLHMVFNAYVNPVASIVGLPAFPGIPTFGLGTTVTAAKLNQLANLQDWLMLRMSLLPRVPFINGMFVSGTHKSDLFFPNNPRPIHISYLNKGNGQNTFKAIIDYNTFNGQEVIVIYINGVLRYTSPYLVNRQVGTLNISFDISDLADSTSLKVEVIEIVTAGQGQAELGLYDPALINSRFTIRKLEATATRSYYTPASDFDVLETMTYSALKTRLTNFTAGTEAAYNRIVSNNNLFNRARMFRKKVGVDDHQNTSLEWQSLPQQIRIGERYVVAGKNVKIAWNGYSITQTLGTDSTDRHPYEFANEKELIGSDKVEVKEGYFDEFDGLFVGSTYYILGNELSFFSEYLR